MQENVLFHDSAQLYSWAPIFLQFLQNVGGWPLCLCTCSSFLNLGLQLPLGCWRYRPSSSQSSHLHKSLEGLMCHHESQTHTWGLVLFMKPSRIVSWSPELWDVILYHTCKLTYSSLHWVHSIWKLVSHVQVVLLNYLSSETLNNCLSFTLKFSIADVGPPVLNE